MKSLFAAILCSTLAAGVQAHDATAPLTLLKTIPLDKVEGRIDHLAVDIQGQRLFVAALGNNTVELLDLKAGTKIQSLPGFAEPQGILYVPALDRLFVANGQDSTCRILDGRSFKTIGTVPFGNDADNVRYDEKAGRIYVGYGDGALGAVEAATGAKVADIKLARHPESFRLETGGTRIFVNVPNAGHIAVVDRDKGLVTETWPIKEEKGNYPLFLDETNHRLFIGCRNPPKLLVYDLSGHLAANLAISGDTDDLF